MEMEGEEVFRAILLLLWFCLFSIRGYYAARLRRGGERVSPRWRAVRQVIAHVSLCTLDEGKRSGRWEGGRWTGSSISEPS